MQKLSVNAGPSKMRFETSRIYCVAAMLIGLVARPSFCLPVDVDQSKLTATTIGPPYVSAYGEYRYASVSTDTIPCSKIGVDILARQGGSATDAAIASLLCQGIVGTQSSGIGGGHFMTIYDKPRGGTEKIVKTITARGMAPSAAYKDMFQNNTAAAMTGGLAVSVPGEVLGMYEAWLLFGRLPWADLFQPAIDICENGFVVERSLSSALAQEEDVIRADPNFSEIFIKEDGTIYTEGDTMTRHKLGGTLRRIAQDPLDFYRGSLAADIVNDIKEYGGILELSDLANYTAKVKDPVSVHLQNGDYRLYSPPPPSSGAVFQFILNILDEYYLNSSVIEDYDTRVLSYHRIIEAFKFAFAKRSDLGDEDYVDVEELVRNLTSDVYASDIRAQINDTHTQDIDYYGPSFDIDTDSGTTHVSVLAPDGGVVAATATINLFFGSKTCGTRSGIIFNNDMDDFSIPGTSNDFGVPASPTNYIEPGKRPMSSMIPTLVVDNQGRVVLASGAAGGTRIITGNAFVTMQNLWFGLDILQATDAARFHHQLVPNRIDYERHFDQTLLRDLEAKGHVTNYYGGIGAVGSISDTCATAVDHLTCIRAVSDARKGGAPDGF